MMKTVVKYTLLVLFVFVCALPLSAFPDYDWRPVFYPNAQAFLNGHSPYLFKNFANPIWTMLLIAPLSLLGADYSRGLIGVLTLLASMWLCWKLKVSFIGTLLFIFSATVFGNFRAGNLDALILLGLFLPVQGSLFVLMTKPQIGLGYILWLGIKSWKTGVFIRTFAPVIIAMGLCLIIYPEWLTAMSHTSEMRWNRSLFPYSIPVGLYILWLAIRKDKPIWALAATAFLSPYLSLYSYVTVQVAVMDSSVKWRDWWLLIFFVISWIIQLSFGR
jgi:hypothetical protein